MQASFVGNAAFLVTPFSEDVLKNYNINNERIQIANYQIDLAMRKLKGSLYESHKSVKVTVEEKKADSA